ncbi:YceD family protein [Kamptonema sp. UHCC 0994]|uniref:YceD family protein n=1 Tax=Kamptonema sp. UHCC 0994 TaxID=3031329 RepID=UPI0023B96960|nr:YceD family protein [Kamptonema sp. UHCC 0994]MDF0553853.1 YceD family protein [Kamptonema sp. UHCC 0994]
MDAIYIPHLLKKTEQKEEIQFEELLPDLETLTPVRGYLRVTHQGTYLDVRAKAETIVTLTCDRCLKQYNHRLAVNTSEMIWLDEAANPIESKSGEIEVDLEDLVETLSPNGYFEAGDWLYQQICLEMPLRKLCDSKCRGIQLTDSEKSQPLSDARWASLEALKKQLPG